MNACSIDKRKVCPSRMNDGRAFTDYRPKCVVNAELMSDLHKQNVLASSYESRMYLQNNAEKMMQMAEKNAIENMLCACSPYENEVQGIDTMAPERYIVKCNSATCYREEINPRGIGDGRLY